MSKAPALYKLGMEKFELIFGSRVMVETFNSSIQEAKGKRKRISVNQSLAVST